MHFMILNIIMIKTCISYLFYSPAKPLCLILFCLVSNVEPAAIEAECADEVVEPPWSASGSLMMSCWDWSFVNIFWGMNLFLELCLWPLLALLGCKL